MTMLTTVLGMVPMALGTGEGGELQAPLGRVVIGGMVTGTMITLIVIPLIFRFLVPDPVGVNPPSETPLVPQPVAVA
jgi:multidrug efflux pump subunit AcrB